MQTSAFVGRFRGAIRYPQTGGVWSGWQPVCVWFGWLAITAWTALFVLRHGHNLPAYDEWAFISISYASWGEKFSWLFDRHMEHRFPLARLVFLTLLDLTGHDYRAGMWLSVGLLSAAAAAFVLAARRLRGRTTLADLGYPFLLVHPGHTENLLMGYQIAFTFTILAVALFVLLIASAPLMPPGRSAFRGAVLLVPIASGGWLGLVFVPPLGLWVGWQAWRAGRDAPGRRAAAGLLAVVFGYLTVSLGILLSTRGENEGATLIARASGVFQVLGIGLGPGAVDHPSHFVWLGAILFGVQLMAAGILAGIGVRRPAERVAAWGLLAVLLGVWAFAFGVGWSRGSGFASRYSAFTAIGAFVPFLTLARYAREIRLASLGAATVVAIGAAVVLPPNDQHAKYQGQFLDAVYQNAHADAATGMPLNVFASRHCHFWLCSDEGWHELHMRGFPLLRTVSDPLDVPAIPLAFLRSGEQRDGHNTFARYRVEAGGEKSVAAVRVVFRPGTQVPWEPLVFIWTDPPTGQSRRSAVSPWVYPHGCDYIAMFWIDGSLQAGNLLAGRPECKIDIISIDYLPRPVRAEARR